MHITKNSKIHNSVPPRLYDLLKLHKTEISPKPVISCIQLSQENLLKILEQNSQNVLNNNDYYKKDSFDFRDKIKMIAIPSIIVFLYIY